MIRYHIQDLKIVLKNFGEVTYYFSMILFLPILISLIYGEGWNNLYPFLIAGIIGMIFGLIVKKIADTNKSSEPIHAFLAIVLVWVFLPLIGAIPFTANSSLNLPLQDAYFESVSALTTTGLTMMQTQILPNSLIFWRALEGWIGGAGIVVLALIGITKYSGVSQLMKAEGREERLRPHIIHTVKSIWWVYTLLTIVGIVLLIGSGLPLFESTNLSMSAISTTGVENYYGDLQIINNIYVEAALAIIMLMGALSFAVHYKVMKGKWKAYVKDTQTRVIFALILFGTLLMLPKFFQIYGGAHSLRYSTFQVISAITAGGFNSVNALNWGGAIKFGLATLMLIGGATGSTAGGIKTIRFWIVLKSIWWKIKESSLPENAYFARKSDNREITEEELTSTYLFIILYLIFILIGTGIILYFNSNYPTTDVLFEVISAQGNAGITSNLTNPAMNLITKLTLISNMIIGRIEIIPLLFGIGFLANFRRRGV